MQSDCCIAESWCYTKYNSMIWFCYTISCCYIFVAKAAEVATAMICLGGVIRGGGGARQNVGEWTKLFHCHMHEMSMSAWISLYFRIVGATTPCILHCAKDSLHSHEMLNFIMFGLPKRQFVGSKNCKLAPGKSGRLLIACEQVGYTIPARPRSGKPVNGTGIGYEMSIM